MRMRSEYRVEVRHVPSSANNCAVFRLTYVGLVWFDLFIQLNKVFCALLRISIDKATGV